ncbi:hypothetical protein L202_07652 [Cryptococcus amylolentus CBS 6039]|uniref:NodB homology domain-containing protein n=1 Tax=Cryptococcus amylolentus CBS 6039 TaxID=1295533 RepID=A0A1E3HEL8_9TREE|nr:hypothetical protein L202_07652 [Cryptococcus amylolentus CBS 6039]ODN74206.1 hypothetical protein L202_07652 [Cryptococcus amylolentus CBS 6039]
MQFLTSLSILAFLGAALASPIVGKRSWPDVIDNCNQDGTVALTYDDGPWDYEEDVANALDGGKATFFFNGNNYECIYDRADQIKALYDAGHTLGSHTWSHADVTELSWDEFHDELWKVEEAFIKILGVKPKYFRPPYGNINDNAMSVLENRGYSKVFLWSDDTEDSLDKGAARGEEVLDGVANDYPNPHLVLSHSTYPQNSQEVLPHSVPKLKSAGYNLVTAGQCVGTDEWPYEWVGEPQARDDSWTC